MDNVKKDSNILYIILPVSTVQTEHLMQVESSEVTEMKG